MHQLILSGGGVMRRRKFNNHVLSFRKLSYNVFVNYDLQPSRVDVSDPSDSCRIDLKFLRDCIDQIFDGTLHEIYCSVVIFRGMSLSDIEAGNCQSVSRMPMAEVIETYRV